ncbi:MAG: nicotinate-nucleotide--dimethylbenzimidazole phosphoribosyltransferase [Azospirillum sp.]|nr:nicotinate-nucleotide--dimethylbenzimidazole phosphoribosyltransferase [Azospirillum sp.]
MTSKPQPAVTLDDMRQLLQQLPGPDLESGTAAVLRQDRLTKPRGALGRLEELAAWLATWQGRHPPELRRPRVAVFAGNHGIAAHGVSAYPAAVTAQMVANFAAGGAAVNQLCQVADADLRVFELDLERPTADFTVGPAMAEEDCARAMAYGMMAVESGIQLLCLGEMGIGNTTVAAALCCALFGGSAGHWVGPGTGVDQDGIRRKVAVVEAGLAANAKAPGDALETLRRLGGYEFSAIIGAILAARMAKVPVVLDGYVCTAAAAVLFKMDPRALDHCLVAHCSAEPAHQRLLTVLRKEPLFDFGMRLGEASGAALAIPILKAAAACHSGMATFDQAGVSEKSE